MDETILPCDHERVGHIRDNELNRALVNPLGPGVVLHAVIDACHSGTMLDLNHVTHYQVGVIITFVITMNV